MNRLGWWAAAVVVAGMTAAAQTDAVKLTPEDLASVAGVYTAVGDPDTVISIYREGGHIYEEAERFARVELTPVTRDRFSAGEKEASFDFVRNASGKVTGATASGLRGHGDEAVKLTRTSDKEQRLNHFMEYTRQELMIPVRDGVKLHTVVLRPAGSETAGEALPFLMERTPYGVDGLNSMIVNARKPELATSGYIFVFQDIRGRYKSEGQFVMNRPIVSHNAKTDVDETTDTRDSIDWLLKNIPRNAGKVGVLGVSYPGFLAISAGIDAHKAVKAISPQAPMTDVWMGDDFFHNGAFRETYGFDYVQQLEGQKTDVPVNMKEDTFDFFLRNGNFVGAAEAARMSQLPTAKIFLTQPSYTKFWQEMAIEKRLTKVEVPTLEVGGWWDQEDMWGTQAEYAALEPHDARGEVFMVLGPWNHGGWAGSGRQLGAISFGEPKAGLA